MNPLPPNADELVSAYLDGEAAPHEIDIVESNQDLMARVDSLRALTSGFSTPLTPPPEQKEAHIAAALGAFDDLFAAAPNADTAMAAIPSLAAVPAAEPDPIVPTTAESPVTSLAAARERRRPRRFNSGVIAAAIAAVLLVAVFAIFGGGSSSDVATSTADQAVQAQAADESADTGSVDAAMDEDAMDSVAESDAARAVPQPTADIAESFATEAMEDDAMEEAAEDEATDEDEAMDDLEAVEDDAETIPAAEPPPADGETSADSGSIDSDSAAGVDEGAELASPFDTFLGEFDTFQELELQIEKPTQAEFDARADLIQDGLFPGCQDLVLELSVVETPTLLGTATLNEQTVEVHLLPSQTGDLSFFVVDARNCEPVTATP